MQAAHVDEQGELGLDLKMLKILSRTSEEEKPHGRLIEQRKIFREGDIVFFSDLELQQILVTIASFADALFKSTAAYAKATRDGTA